MSVRIENNISKKNGIAYGAPQGSILGPILLGIYVNDLFSHVNCFLVQYADDAQFLHSIIIDKLDHLIKDTEETLVKGRRYFLKNGLMFSSSKTQCVFIGNRQLLSSIPPNTTINFNGDILYQSNHVKNLGVYIDRYMIFKVHINELNKKVMGILMYISRISDKLDKQNIIIIIETLVLSLIDFYIKIWGTTNDKHMSNAHILQNFGGRVAFGGVRKYDHISPVFREMQWLRIRQKYLLDVGVTVFKVIRGFYPDLFLSFKSRPLLMA